MIRICLVAPPYSGHLNPLLGLGRELAGIAEVTMISTPGAMRAVAAAGLRGHPILEAGETLVNEIASPGASVKNHPLLLFRQLKANVSLQVEMAAELDAAFAVLKPDLVIADFTLPVAGPVAARHGACWWTNLPSPCVFETPDGPPAYFGGLSPAESALGELGHRALRKLTRGFKRLMFFLFRGTFRRVGLPSIYREDGSERVYSPERILACSIEEIEFRRSYPPHFHFIGPSLYTPPVAVGGVPEFLPGKKHVLVTVGTHLAHRKNEIAEGLRAIAQGHPEWVIHFSDGTPAASGSQGEGNFHRYAFISYDDWLPHYEAVVHHGGSGVMLHCMRHGIPAVVMPLDFDQFDNAARLVSAGVARSVKTVGQIEEAVASILSDEGLAENCREFSAMIASYDSGATVRQWVKEHFEER